MNLKTLKFIINGLALLENHIAVFINIKLR